MLASLEKSSTAEDVSTATGLPLYRVRGGMRELKLAGFIEQIEDRYQPTALGSSALTNASKA